MANLAGALLGILFFVSAPSLAFPQASGRSVPQPQQPPPSPSSGIGSGLLDNSGVFLDLENGPLKSGQSGTNTGTFGNQCITEIGRCNTEKAQPLGSECKCYDFDDRKWVQGKVKK
jgi:hypothetical protein